MKSYLIRRLLIAIPVLLGITFISFFVIHMVPGSPVDLMVGPDMTEEARQALEHSMGLDAPIYQQYLTWLGNLLRGELGYSYSSYRPVVDVIAERLPATLLLMGTALAVGLLIAVPLGILSALKQHSIWDYLATFLAFFGVSVPNFFLGLGLIYIFSVKLGLLPSSGMFTLGTAGGFADVARHIVLPCIVLSVNIAGRFIRYVRSAMLEVLGQDYLRTATAKGVRYWRKILIHALRNALLPLITLIGLELPTLLSGAVVTEQIFVWPGIGRLTMDSILTRDFPVLMGLNLMSAVVVLLASLITDIVYAVADPRIKYQ